MKGEKTEESARKQNKHIFDKNGLKYKNWMYLMVFSVLILAVLFILQFLFLSTFYMTMKRNEVEHIGAKVVAEYRESGFSENVTEYAFNNNLRITLLNENGIMSTGSDGFGSNMMQGDFLSRRSDFLLAIQALNNSGKNAYCYTNAAEERDMTHIIYIAKVINSENNINYIYVSSPVPPIDSTASVLRTQFVLIAVILLILSIIAAQIISKKMSKPIIKLTKSAEKLAAGDLTTQFDGEGYTETHQLAGTLNYATTEISKLDSYRKEIMANVSHDLRTPLTRVKMYAEMIRDVAGDNKLKRDAHSEMIINEADKLTDMVNEILEVSRLESSGMVIEKSNINLGECLRETLRKYDALCERDGYIFDIDIDDNLQITGNENYMKRAMNNLISNAVNYTGDDKKVSISLKNLGERVRFEVRDTGEGIPQDKLANIWERYYKSDKSHKRAIVGTGLGLSIVKQSLEFHKAQYGVISRINEGSTFWFEIPLGIGDS